MKKRIKDQKDVIFFRSDDEKKKKKLYNKQLVLIGKITLKTSLRMD